ncbi:hypothetical protein [Tenacibaculum dicentrarchi]|uniref:hypothetical protein n=1 Tax=Tenacibaculum dicentrarchi TaxID=669041 RepID=UPI000C7DDAE0|nr:hypothetical protein TDCHD05_70133 [Tenacibaculum dicentrarchi]
MNKNKIIYLTITLISALLLGFLTPNKTHILRRIETDSSVYWKANYSEYSCDPSIDLNGNPYLDCDTDYWSETVSDIYYIKTEFSDLGFTYVDYYPLIPEVENVFIQKDEPLKIKDYSLIDLDNVKLIKEINTKCWYDVGVDKEDYVTIKFSEYNTFKNKIGEKLVFTTWFGLRLWLN